MGRGAAGVGLGCGSQPERASGAPAVGGAAHGAACAAAGRTCAAPGWKRARLALASASALPSAGRPKRKRALPGGNPPGIRRQHDRNVMRVPPEAAAPGPSRHILGVFHASGKPWGVRGAKPPAGNLCRPWRLAPGRTLPPRAGARRGRAPLVAARCRPAPCRQSSLSHLCRGAPRRGVRWQVPRACQPSWALALAALRPGCARPRPSAGGPSCRTGSSPRSPAALPARP